MVSTVFRKGEHRWRRCRGEKTHVIISKVLSFSKVHVCVFIWECVLMCMYRDMLMLMHVETGGQTQVLFLQRQPATLVLSYLSVGPGLADYARLADL